MVNIFLVNSAHRYLLVKFHEVYVVSQYLSLHLLYLGSNLQCHKYTHFMPISQEKTGLVRDINFGVFPPA